MKTYADQVHEHLAFLHRHGLDVQSLETGRMVRCHEVGHTEGRGKLVYSCSINAMEKGYVGLSTWCRAPSGKTYTFKTYGLPPAGDAVAHPPIPLIQVATHDRTIEHEEAARRSYGFWQNCSPTGTSDYLIRKGVGHYGIRFRRSDQYGNVAVVPMFDERGRLWSYQLLNPDGSKRMPKGARTKGLFHILGSPIDGQPIGVSESYVTSATCYELSGFPTACSFSSDNLPDVVAILRKLYPNSPIIIFADNDKHLEEMGLANQGVCMALKAIKSTGRYVAMAEVEFFDSRPSKDVSDWNDLVREKGVAFAKKLILEKIGHSLAEMGR
jgi:phage/plasmid primase-like uncharacterized protein